MTGPQQRSLRSDRRIWSTAAALDVVLPPLRGEDLRAEEPTPRQHRPAGTRPSAARVGSRARDGGGFDPGHQQRSRESLHHNAYPLRQTAQFPGSQVAARLTHHMTHQFSYMDHVPDVLWGRVLGTQ